MTMILIGHPEQEVHVKNPGSMDENKLIRMMKFLKCMKDNVLTLSAKNGASRNIWSIDSAFRVHLSGM